jgi:hypothetical protein
MKARQLLRYKGQQGDLVDDRLHGLKYRLFCGRRGECLVRYDNEAGKGDHRHYGEREEPYPFKTVERLLADFRADCARLADWSWK